MISVVKSAPPPRTAVRNKRLCTGQRPEVVPRADLQEETSPRRTGWSKREGVSDVGAGRACQAQCMVPDCGEGPWLVPQTAIEAVWQRMHMHVGLDTHMQCL